MQTEFDILLIERSGDSVETIQRYLKLSAHEYRVEHTADIMRGIDLLQDGEFDAILLDTEGLDSEYVELLGKQTKAASIPVILLSSKFDTDSLQEVSRFEASDFVIKHKLNFYHLHKVIEQALEVRRLKTELHAAKKDLERQEILTCRLLENVDRMLNRVNDGIFVMDEGGEITYANDKANLMLLGKGGQQITRAAKLLFDNQEESEITVGSQRIGRWKLSVFETLWQGKAAHMVLVSEATDTDKLQANLKAANESVDSLLMADEKPLLIHDGFKILEVNPSFVELTGIYATDLEGGDLTDWLDAESEGFDDLPLPGKAMVLPKVTIGGQAGKAMNLKAKVKLIAYRAKPVALIEFEAEVEHADIESPEVHQLVDSLGGLFTEGLEASRGFFEGLLKLGCAYLQVPQAVVVFNDDALEPLGYSSTGNAQKALDSIQPIYTRFILENEITDVFTGIGKAQQSEVLTYLATPIKIRGKASGVLYFIEGQSKRTKYSDKEKSFTEKLAHLIGQIVEFKTGMEGEVGSDGIYSIAPSSRLDAEQVVNLAAHDLREPIRTILNYAQLISDKIKKEDYADLDDYIKYTLDGADRIEQLLKDLRAYIDIPEEGNPQNTATGSLVEEAMLNLREEIERTDAGINVGMLPVAKVDEQYFTLLIQILLANALKFIKEGQKPLIHIASQAETDHYIFSVRDNGIGIDPKYHSRAFELFERLNRVDEYQGTGTGLAIAKKIVGMHGGKIWVESSLGQGSTFYFSIPR